MKTWTYDTTPRIGQALGCPIGQGLCDGAHHVVVADDGGRSYRPDLAPVWCAPCDGACAEMPDAPAPRAQVVRNSAAYPVLRAKADAAGAKVQYGHYALFENAAASADAERVWELNGGRVAA